MFCQKITNSYESIIGNQETAIIYNSYNLDEIKNLIEQHGKDDKDNNYE